FRQYALSLVWHCGLYRHALLRPVENRKPIQIHIQCTLTASDVYIWETQAHFSRIKKCHNADDSGNADRRFEKILVARQEQIDMGIKRRSQDRPILRITDFYCRRILRLRRGHKLDM